MDPPSPGREGLSLYKQSRFAASITVTVSPKDPLPGEGGEEGPLGEGKGKVEGREGHPGARAPRESVVRFWPPITPTVCQWQSAAKVIPPFIIFAVFDVSFRRYNL